MFSPRQLQVLHMLTDCMTYKEIAIELGIAASTVNDKLRERLRDAGYVFRTRREFLDCINDWVGKNE